MAATSPARPTTSWSNHVLTGRAGDALSAVIFNPVQSATVFMNPADIISQLDSITQWKKGTQRAPHKPLLLLMALAAVQRRESRLLPYAEVDEKLSALLAEFGPPRKVLHPEYSFWRLQNDGDFWEIPQRAELEKASGITGSSGNVNMSRRRLLDLHASGGFTAPVHAYLTANPQVVNELTAKILQANFPASLHEDLLDAVGMPWVQVVVSREARDPGFREAVIRIYEHRCAVCGFDGRLGMSDLALEAAHVMWHAAGGPDHEENGLALCVLHHRLLDRGALGLTPDHRILVSQSVHGGAQVQESIVRYAGRALARPQPGTPAVARRYIDWHGREVFKGPAREMEHGR